MPGLNIASLFVGVSANTAPAVTSLNALEQTLRSTASRLQSTGAAMTTVLGAPVALAGGAIVKLGSDYETAMQRVRKTTGLTAEDTKALGKGILDLSTSTAGGARTAEDLAKIAEVGGQLGIAKEGLLDFTRVIAQFSGATNIAGAEAAASLESLRLLTGVDPSQLENLSSTIVDLGNKTNATESQILESSLLLAGALHTAGASAQEILGISTTLASLHVNPEAGGTAISKFFIDMVSAASGAGGAVKDTSGKTRELQEHLQDLSTSLNAAQLAQTQFGRNTPAAAVAANTAAIARYKREIGDAQADLAKLDTAQTDAKGSAAAMARVAGITTDEFKALVKADPTAAFTKIVQGIKRISQTEGAGAAFGAIESLGVNDAREIRAMLGLAEGAGVLTSNIDIANAAFKDNTAAAVENALQMETVAAQFEILKNKIVEQIIAGWDLLKPHVEAAMRVFTDNVVPALYNARVAFAGLPEPVRNFGIALGVLLVVLGPVLVAVGLLAGALASLSLPVLGAAAAIAVLAAVWITNLGDIQGKTAATIQFIQDNWQKLAISIPILGPALILIAGHFDEIKAAVGRVLSFFATSFLLMLSIADRVTREVGAFFTDHLLGPIQSVGQWIGEHILSPLVELLKFLQKIIAGTGLGAALGGFDIGEAIRGGELAIQKLSGGIAAGGPGTANSIVVNLNNPAVPDQTVAERLAAEVTKQVVDALVAAERAAIVPPLQGQPGVPF